ncbi:MAG: hypothetical protein IK025_03735 [Bacteroidales bacterium]|nr:hypothetical protein [Bacteroidales bacterium]
MCRTIRILGNDKMCESLFFLATELSKENDSIIVSETQDESDNYTPKEVEDAFFAGSRVAMAETIADIVGYSSNHQTISNL